MIPEIVVAYLTNIYFSVQVKLDKTANNKPSRVIHIRNIPNEVTEAEVIHLGIPFGKVTNVLVLKGKNQVRIHMYYILYHFGVDCYKNNIISGEEWKI